jgi:pyruvate,water dikinase
VVEELMPELRQTGERLAAEELNLYDDDNLADRIAERRAIVQRWKKIYWDEFIPFAHGVRYLGLYYNDAVRPADPYEFVGILQGEELLAVQRNRTLKRLAWQLRENRDLETALRDALERAADSNRLSPPPAPPDGDGPHAVPGSESHSAARAQPHPDLTHVPWTELESIVSATEGAGRFLEEFRELLRQFMDITFSGQRLMDHAPQLLRTVLELASQVDDTSETAEAGSDGCAAELEQRLLDAVGPGRHDEAKEVIRLGRLSWRLRDDDNILVARLESQLLRALQVAATRLQQAGRLNRDAGVVVQVTDAIVAALRDAGNHPITLPPEELDTDPAPPVDTRETPRQLIGQPAAPGFATGTLRVIRGPRDLGAFQAGEVLVCDAIQPTMTHVVPLAAAVVERRGGMLIHGAIIARELGIPCVNGVPEAATLLADGQHVAVDGHLGIVTVGEPEFDLELE